MFAQIIRFTLPPTLTISTPLFQELRQKAASAGATAQYYGYSVRTAAPLPKKRHEICWAISALVNVKFLSHHDHAVVALTQPIQIGQANVIGA